MKKYVCPDCMASFDHISEIEKHWEEKIDKKTKHFVVEPLE